MSTATVTQVVPIGITVVCQGCGGEISATNDPECNRCYWCANDITPAELRRDWWIGPIPPAVRKAAFR